jgi:hypothetical protein
MRPGNGEAKRPNPTNPANPFHPIDKPVRLAYNNTSQQMKAVQIKDDGQTTNICQADVKRIRYD